MCSAVEARALTVPKLAIGQIRWKWEMMDKSRLGSLRGIWLAGGGRGLRKTGDAWTPDFWEYRVDVLLATCTVYRICHKTGRQLLPFSKQALARLDNGKGDRCTSKVGFACDLVDGDIGEHYRIHTSRVLELPHPVDASGKLNRLLPSRCPLTHTHIYCTVLAH
jgi:hypothetical protein